MILGILAVSPPRFRYAVNQIALSGLLSIQSQSILSLGHLTVPMSTLAGFAVEQLISDAINKTLEEHFGPRPSVTQPATQPIAQPINQSIDQSIAQSITQYQPKQYKKEMEHTPSVEKKPGKHVVLRRISAVKSVAWEWPAVIHCWHAVIQWNEMTMKDGTIMVDCATIGMPRIGIG